MFDLHVHITRPARAERKLERASWLAGLMACVVAGLTFFGVTPSVGQHDEKCLSQTLVVKKTVVIYRNQDTSRRR